MSHLDGIHPGPVVLVAFIEIDGLLDGANVDARQPADGLHHVTVGAGIVDRPVDEPFVQSSP